MQLTAKQLARMIDSTNIGTLATKQGIDEMIEQAKEYEIFALNGPACYFPYLVEQLKGSNTYPNFGCTRWSGADPTHVKVYAAKWAIENGAKEIDMVMNQSYLMSGMYDEAVADIHAVKEAVGDHVVKAIIECPLHTDEEIITASKIIIDSGADSIKTCTGTEGHFTQHHVDLIMNTIASYATRKVWVKVAGGVRSLEIVDKLADMGVARFGINYRSAKVILDEARNR